MAKRNSKRSVPRRKRNVANMLFPGPSRPSIPAQVRTRIRINYPRTLLTSAPTTGIIAANYVPTLASLTNVSALQAQFSEFRILAIDFHVMPCSANNGTTKFWISDSDASTAPTLTMTDQVRGWLLPNNSSNPRSQRTFKYRSQNVPDMQFLSTATSASATLAALKVYTDLNNFRSGASTDLWQVWADVLFEFRGAGSATA